MPLKIGDKAPNFSLYSDEKKLVNLGDYEGENLLILFFPLAFTGTCTAELCHMRDDIATYDGMNTHVLGISIDTPMTLGKFKESLNVAFPLLSDFNKEVARSYDALYEEFVLGMKGVAKRSAFIVDKGGVIRYAEVLDNAGELPNFEAIVETLKGLN